MFIIKHISISVQRISEGALSPDGTVLATASHDGYVKFWQIYIEGQDQPRYMFETLCNWTHCTVQKFEVYMIFTLLRN